MELKVGKKYKTRDGDIVECVIIDERLDLPCICIFTATDCETTVETYSLDGHFHYERDQESSNDIIEEYKEPFIWKEEFYLIREKNEDLALCFADSHTGEGTIIAKKTLVISEGEGM